MLGGNDAELDRLVAALEAEDEERAAAAERRDRDVAMQLYEADLVDAGHRLTMATSTMLADVQQRLEAAEASDLAEQATWHKRKKKLREQQAKRHAWRQSHRLTRPDLLVMQSQFADQDVLPCGCARISRVSAAYLAQISRSPVKSHQNATTWRRMAPYVRPRARCTIWQAGTFSFG